MTGYSLHWYAGATHYAQVEYDPPRAQLRIYVEGSYKQVCDVLRQNGILEHDLWKYLRSYPESPHSTPRSVCCRA